MFLIFGLGLCEIVLKTHEVLPCMTGLCFLSTNNQSFQEIVVILIGFLVYEHNFLDI